MMGKYRIRGRGVATGMWLFCASAMLVMLMLAYLEWRVGGVRWFYGLMLCVGWPLLGIGLGAVFYTPLKYRFLGDVVILLSFCVLPALGTSYVAVGQFELAVLWVALPVGLLASAILHANNMRGVVRFYLFDTFFPFVWVIALALCGELPLWCVLVVQLLPLAWRNARQMLACRSEADAAAGPTPGRASVKLQLLFCAVLIFNLFLDLWLR